MSSTTTRTALEPLRALRYDGSRAALEDVICPPYDVISPADREALLKRSEYAVVRLELPDSPASAAQLLHEWVRDGVLVRDSDPTLWWHEQRFTGPDGVDRTRAGFFAAVRLSPYEQGRVRPHERTHAHAKQTRLELMRATRANTSPIFGLYDDAEGGPRAALAPDYGRSPDMQATDGDGTVHRFWSVTSAGAIASAQAALAEREILIADGHHRYETALTYRAEQRERDGDPADDRPYDFILMYLANLHGEGLVIYPTHRVVRAAREVDPRFLAAFAVTELPAGTSPARVEAELAAIPTDTVAFAIWRGGDRPPLLARVRDTSTVMMAMPGMPKAVRAIDAAVLEALVLAPLLGLDGEQFLTTDQVLYVRGLDNATSMVDRGEAGSAFLLRAPTVEQVQAVAASGRVMPQKSTYFFPKLATGFLLNPLGAE
ncbi:MAG: hypothetical protein QOF08_1416 [Gaiellales bacterium]|nr:hypothetical protein [Gaiellales bacterium]